MLCNALLLRNVNNVQVSLFKLFSTTMLDTILGAFTSTSSDKKPRPQSVS